MKNESQFSGGDLSEANLQTKTIVRDLANDLDLVEPVAVEFETEAKACGWNNEELNHPLLAFREILANAMIHGNKLDPQKTVHLNLIISPEEIKCSIIDQGAGFQDEDIPNPTSDKNIRNPSGRGIFLIKQLMGDSFAHHTLTTEDGKTTIGHEVTLVWRRYKS